MRADTASLATVATREYALRRKTAMTAVAANQLAHEQAMVLLRPWAAIALLAGGTVPQLEQDVADRTDEATPIQFAKLIVAIDLCSRAEWVAALATARDRAVEAAERNPDHVERARGLQRLARYFAHDPAGQDHVPPYRPFEPVPTGDTAQPMKDAA
ncbi:hypothetical protein [Croceicoccus gelatinilyticus]|uniref:hypothetical protein n=1 Tax=Croceicoccus gelatinilyticus TaxID=2835536 RepID=UPI001BCC1C67|nr:hypothetical protein [Croceicoccus gelatinilyticus]MBS7669368.1 hypothetical protein [Croceicoccus gelatinilyticus]